MKLLNIFLWCTLLVWLVSCNSSDPSVINIYNEGASGNTPAATVDITAPVIIALDITIGLGDTWDDNVAALDDIDGIISADVVITGDVVDENAEGGYTLLYDVTDVAGNDAVQVSRTVTVSYCTSARIADTPYANSNEAPTGDGVGTPYTICSLTQLAAIATNIATDKALDFDLKTDIDAAVTSGWDSGAGWTPIGVSPNIYTGTFNGNNHVISNLFIDRADSNQALFGYVQNTTIQNIGLESVNITGAGHVGGLIGYCSDTSINNTSTTGTISGTGFDMGGLIGNAITSSVSNSYSSVNISSTNYSVGGLVGKLSGESSTLNNSYATGSIMAVGKGGGLVGEIYGGTVNDSYATGNITVTTDRAGGLVGYINYPATVNNSFATGTVTASSHAGGLVGYSKGKSTFGVIPVYIRNSFATGDIVSCDTYCGGFVGIAASTHILENNYRYFDHDLDTTDDANGTDGALNTTITDYYDFTAAPLSSWDFTNDWLENINLYPSLR